MKSFLILLFLVPVTVHGQLAIWVKDENTAEFNAVVSTYALFPESGEPGILFRDLRLELEGAQGPFLDYKFQVDVANLIYRDQGSAVVDAHITLDLPEQVDLIAGYQLVPFSRNSIIGFRHSPYFQRTTLVDGNLFARRDLGLVLQKQALQNQFMAYAGVFGGSGRFNPYPNGKAGITTVARAEMAFPSRFRYEEIDLRHSPIPRAVVGVNGLWSTQQADSISFFLPFWVNGDKAIGGLDAAFCYQGLSLQAEWLQARILPADETAYSVYGGFVSGNYYLQPLKTALAFRYESYVSGVAGASAVQAARAGVNTYLDQSHRRTIRVEYCFYSTFDPQAKMSGLGEGLRIGLQIGL